MRGWQDQRAGEKVRLGSGQTPVCKDLGYRAKASGLLSYRQWGVIEVEPVLKEGHLCR